RLGGGDERTGHGGNHLECDGGRNRNGRRVFEGPRLRRVAWAGTETNLDWRPNNPRQHIKTGQSLSARPVRPGGLGGVGQGGAKALGERYGLKSWIEAAKKRLHHNVLAIALANKLARIAWSVLAHGRTFEASKIQAA